MKTGADEQRMRSEVNEFKKQVAPEIILSTIFTSVLIFLSFYDYLPWKIVDNQHKNQLSFKRRYIFTLQLVFVDILPLLICIFVVFNRRRQTYAINPMDPRGEESVQALKGILQNTLEQFIVKVTLSFLLSIVLYSNELMLLPTFTFLFILGRLTFALGYPTHRSFGMTMNFLSVILVTCLITYRLLLRPVLFSRYIYWK